VSVRRATGTEKTATTDGSDPVNCRCTIWPRLFTYIHCIQGHRLGHLIHTHIPPLSMHGSMEEPPTHHSALSLGAAAQQREAVLHRPHGVSLHVAGQDGAPGPAGLQQQVHLHRHHRERERGLLIHPNLT
jgi:hypothetical protein